MFRKNSINNNNNNNSNVDQPIVGSSPGSMTPELFRLIDRGEWRLVEERAHSHPHEARIWVHLKKVSSRSSGGYDQHSSGVPDDTDLTVGNDSSANRSLGTVASSNASTNSAAGTTPVVQCMALHYACQRLRSVHGRIQTTLQCLDETLSGTSVMSNQRLRSRTISSDIDASDGLMALGMMSTVLPTQTCANDTQHQKLPLSLGDSMQIQHEVFNATHESTTDNSSHEDPWIDACKAILALTQAHPEAAGTRETRHGCLPLHLAVFSMCPTPVPSPSILCQNSHVLFTQAQQQQPLPTKSSFNNTGSNKNNLASQRNKGRPFDINTTKAPSFSSSSSSNKRSWLTRVRRRTKSLSNVTLEPVQTEEGEAMQDCSRPLSTSLHQLASEAIEYEDRDYILENQVDDIIQDEPFYKLDKPMLHAISSNSTKGGSSVASTSSSSYMNPQYPSPIHLHMVPPASFLRPPSSGTSSTSHIHSSSSFTEKILPHFYVSQYAADALVREEYSTQVLHSLLLAYPKSVRIDSEGSRLPLHTAVAGRAILPVIRRLLAAYPDAARHRNKEGYLPLHLAAHWGVSSPLVAPLLLLAYPDACVGKNRWERTPLEEALAIAGENGRLHQISLVRALRRHPSYWTRVWNKVSGGAVFGQLSVVGDMDHLEQILVGLLKEEENINIDTIGDLEGSTQDCNDAPVIHIQDEDQEKINSNSCHDRATLETLIKTRSWAPLVSRLQNNSTEVSILRKTAVRAGYTARISLLYLACERNPPLHIVETLVSLCPVSTMTRKEPGGQLPLHAACTWGAPFAVISFLIGIHPQACAQMDDLGNLPLHCACFSGCSDDIMDALLNAYPRSVLIRNEHGSVPSDIVRRLRHANKRSVLAMIDKIELHILLRPRSMSQELASTVVIVPTKHTSSHDMDHEQNSDVGMKDSEPMVFIERNDVVDDDGMMWI